MMSVDTYALFIKNNIFPNGLAAVSTCEAQKLIYFHRRLSSAQVLLQFFSLSE